MSADLTQKNDPSGSNSSSTLSPWDLGVVFLCLAGALVASYLFFVTSQETRAQGDREEIARLVSAARDVRHKPLTSTHWSQVERGQSLFVNDFLYSGDDSEGRIRFTDGAELILGPRTLVSLRRRGRDLQIDFRYGTLIAGGDSSQNLVSIAFPDGSVKPMRDLGRVEVAHELLPSEWGAGLETVGILSPVVSSEIDQSIISEALLDENFVESEVLIQLTAPANGSIFYFSESSPAEVPISWSGGPEEVSPQYREIFLRLYREDEVMRAKYLAELTDKAWTIQLSEPGFYRAQIGQGENLLESVEFRVEPLLAPRVNPSEGVQEVFSDQVWSPRWPATAGADSYHFELLDGEGAVVWSSDRLTSSQLSLEPREVFDPIESESYFWRVRAVTRSGIQSPWANRVKVRFKASSLKRPEIRIVGPPVSFAHWPHPTETPLSITDLLCERDIRIEWSQEQADFSYLEWSQDSGFMEAQGAPLTTGEFEFCPEEIGRTFLRVRSHGHDERMSPFSEVVEVRKILRPPVVRGESRITGPSGSGRVFLDYESLTIETPIEIEWRSSEGQPGRRILENPNAPLVGLANGSYEVRLRHVSVNGVPLSPVSEWQKMEILIESASEPEEIEPAFDSLEGLTPEEIARGMLFSTQGARPWYEVSWDEQEGAVNYEIEWGGSEDLASSQSQSTRSPRHVFSVDRGQVLYWRQRAVFEDGSASDWSPVKALETRAIPSRQRSAPQ